MKSLRSEFDSSMANCVCVCVFVYVFVILAGHVADLVCEFLEVAVHLLLCVREIYPPGTVLYCILLHFVLLLPLSLSLSLSLSLLCSP
jgi:hypothetical protein